MVAGNAPWSYPASSLAWSAFRYELKPISLFVSDKENLNMTRRQMLALAGSAPAWMVSTSSAAAPDFTRMGGTPTAFSIRSRAGGGGRGGAGRGGAAQGAAPPAAPRPPFDIVEHCHNIGMGGVQIGGLPGTDAESIKQLRARVEGYNFHVVIDPRLPQPGGDLAAFDAQVKAIKEVGATAMHAAMTNRRYEDFDSFAPWKQMFERNQKTIEAVLPVLEKYKIPLAIENHKGWRSPEQAAWMKRLSSEYVGVCLDFGNNVSLCEDPMDTLNNLLPYVVFAHIKDMGVLEYEDGFLLSEVRMGEGFLDLKGMVQILRKKNPNMIIDLEMITRDPLKIPVYTTKYWGSFDDPSSPLPGRDLAKVLDRVRKSKKPLPSVAGLTPEQQLKAEDDNNNRCVAYAKQNLGL
jgi:sugar phosphate isomerase/epimerase